MTCSLRLDELSFLKPLRQPLNCFRRTSPKCPFERILRWDFDLCCLLVDASLLNLLHLVELFLIITVIIISHLITMKGSLSAAKLLSSTRTLKLIIVEYIPALMPDGRIWPISLQCAVHDRLQIITG